MAYGTNAGRMTPGFLVGICLLAGTVCIGGEQDYRQVDLRPVVNMGWKDEAGNDGEGGWTDQGRNDMRYVDLTRDEFAKIPFELIEPAQNNGKAVLVLKSKHTPFSADSVSDPVRCGKELEDWWSPEHGENYRVGFYARNERTSSVGMCVYGWDNPHPEKAIGSLEFRSENGGGCVIVAGVALSSKAASLPPNCCGTSHAG